MTETLRDTAVHPFVIDIPQADLDDIKTVARDVLLPLAGRGAVSIRDRKEDERRQLARADVPQPPEAAPAGVGPARGEGVDHRVAVVAREGRGCPTEEPGVERHHARCG